MGLLIQLYRTSFTGNNINALYVLFVCERVAGTYIVGRCCVRGVLCAVFILVALLVCL